MGVRIGHRPVVRGGGGGRAAELARAARILAVRSRREVGGALVGGYRSAFRGVGIEFEESRLYAPGDDVRLLDASGMARTGLPYVKRFREERDQTLHLLVDVSASMAFGSLADPARSKGALAARVASLLAVAAMRAGDRVGLHTFDESVRDELAPARSPGRLHEILELLAEAPGHLTGATGLGAAVARARQTMRRRSLVLVISDFRDDGFFAPPADDASPAPARPLPAKGPIPAAASRAEWVALNRHHEVVAVLIHDHHEDELTPAGTLRLRDPEHPDATRWLRTGDVRVRRRFRAASRARRRATLRRLHEDGALVLPLRTDREPLPALVRFFAERAGDRAGRRAR